MQPNSRPALIDVGQIRVEGAAADATVFIEADGNTGSPRTFRFAESLGAVSDAITIDEATWRSTWPDLSLTAASIAMFSVHVREAIDTAPSGATVLRQVPSGVIAV